jgi:LAO/AO transport system kinase
MPRFADVPTLITSALDGDRRSLARLISAVERPGDDARAALAALFPRTGSAFVTGVTGSPGAGKSTLTDRLITLARSSGEVAVLAVDPSSPFTGGAILGDRVRMQEHIDDGGVYIRSLSSRGSLGGISEATPRALAVLDAVGFPEVFVETVGVGQSEVEVAANADTTVVVVNPRWGDSIQAAKAGLLEVGDVFVVNKADRPGVEETVRDLKQMLELGGQREWWPPIVATVATAAGSVADLWGAIAEHRDYLVGSGELGRRRSARLRAELDQAIDSMVRHRTRRAIDDAALEEAMDSVVERRVDPWSAAFALLGPDPVGPDPVGPDL